MSQRYNPQEIEPKWQQTWAEQGLYKTVEDPSRPKWYALTMLPYPSGDLHTGHWYAFTPSDAAARFRRMNGYNVFFPIGFDAFGLPAENAAIKRNVHPKMWTYANIERMRAQLRRMGAMWAWDREAISCDPDYYKWTQWFFLRFYEAGLAYREFSPVDWCPNCNTTLAREQVWGDDRHCERCGTPVIKKPLNQWKFRITNYADELVEHLERIEWPERVKVMQNNWIGRSEGAQVTFHTEQGDALEIFTTRPDTLWGATFMVLAPEHPLVDKITSAEQRAAMEEYKAQTARLDEIARGAADKEKTGVFTGGYATNPVNGERIPVWIADYVMMGYGTGAIMAVPGHDERDFAFALKFGLPIIPVIERSDGVTKSYARLGAHVKPGFTAALEAAGIGFTTKDDQLFVTMSAAQAERYIAIVQQHLQPDAWNELVGGRWAFIFADGVVAFDSVAADRQIMARCWALEPSVADKRTVMEMLHGVPFYRDMLLHTEYNTMINSGEFTDTPGAKDGNERYAKSQVIGWLEATGKGQRAVNYRLRDWLISRQRMWGSPIPMIFCEKCGVVPVPYADLPVLLPDDAEFKPTGESPLKYHEGFRYVQCPQCGGDAERETDTMDTFMCSSWYQYAYIAPHWMGGEPIHRDDMPWDKVRGEYWLPVDQYTGGIEHATMHLLYTRFFTKALRDIGVVDFDEPMQRLFNQGMILGPDGEKMSKSRGNVVNPDEMVDKYGADTVRGYLMFIGPWDMGGPWDPSAIEGVHRFLYRCWNVVMEEPDSHQMMATPTSSELRNLERKLHQTILKVTEDISHFRFNTAIAALMELNNILFKAKDSAVVGTEAWHEALETMLKLIAPIFPHISEELWQHLGHRESVHLQRWPQGDPEKAKEDEVEVVVQVNGKVRDKLIVAPGTPQATLQAQALALENVQKWLDGKQVRKVIVVPDRLVNVVIG
jgi:leucyl-tRNA synthetase